jgi:SnoaL-like domain
MTSQLPSGDTKTKRELLNTLYTNFNARKIDAVLAMLDPAVDWPNGMEGGRVHGREEVRAYWERQWATINPNVEPTRITEDDRGRAVVEVHHVVRNLDGKILVDQMVRHVYDIRGGLVQSMEIRNPEAASGD